MSSLTATEKRYFETLFRMGSGYVLDFTDATFAEFFHAAKIDIHSKKYQTYGSSKAKKIKAFWEQESDQTVGQVLSEMLDLHQTNCELDGHDLNEAVYAKCRKIVERLTGKKKNPKVNTEDVFLEMDIAIPSLKKNHA